MRVHALAMPSCLALTENILIFCRRDLSFFPVGDYHRYREDSPGIQPKNVPLTKAYD